MTKGAQTVLAVGATGKFAGYVVPELVKRGAKVRALVRGPAQADAAKAAGATDVAIGDLRDSRSLANAVAGVDGIFHIGPAFAPDEATMGVALVDAAQRAGVSKFVFSSVIQPTNTRLKNHASKIPVEEALYSSRLEYTILHPANLMQNIGFAWQSILQTGQFSEPFPRDASIARVDYRDVAEVAAIALTGPTLTYATLELAAGMHSRTEVAAIMTEELSRPISAEESTFGEWVAASKLPYDESQLQLLSKVHEHYAKYGLGGNTLTLRAALGREPRSLRQYIRQLALQTSISSSRTTRSQ
ncbi:NmrA family NAD(P)-binding protein [Rhizobium sp. LC145]|uniref:NmrA family NAD(P)-binding protein n=1 Tax=Rhizobium sp. LC145 TaxID=1120688 RepID=UPI000629DF5C|nr:NmrA family NAD(P)-binding protein [Rhizobium sp. LC145]KKX33390.1 epimerase [Rhizobium sp. LC145]TKT58638.1 NmrA/HSCARG family protein [Rhizobiaceae bacterium LC148]